MAEEQDLWIDTSEKATNSLGLPVVGGPAASSKLEVEIPDQTWYQTLGIATDDQTETLAEGVVDSFTSGGNYAVDILQDYRRAYENPVDPNYDPQAWLAENRTKNQIESQYLSAFSGTGSAAEADALLADINERRTAQQRINRLGITGQLTSGMIAGMFDLDTVLSGGVALIGKAGIAGTKMGQIVAGGLSGAAAASLGAAASPEDDWSNVAVAALLSAGVGSFTGTSKTIDPLAERVNTGIKDAVNDLDTHLQTPKPDSIIRPDQEARRPVFTPDPIPVPENVVKPVTAPVAEGVEKVEPNPTSFDASDAIMDVQDEVWEAGRTSNDKGSIGARQLAQTDLGIQTPSTSAQSIIQASDDYVRNNDLDSKYYYDYGAALNGTPTQKRVAEVTRKGLDLAAVLGLRTDFDRLYKSGSNVMKTFAHTFLSDGTGRMPNVRAAVHLMNDWREQLTAVWKLDMDEAWNSYAKRNGASIYKRPTEYFAARADFDKQVMMAQDALRIDGKYPAGINTEVLQAAQAVDRWAAKDVEIGKGNGSTTSIPGYERMNVVPGYVPRKVTSKHIYGRLRMLAKEAQRLGTKATTESDVRHMWAEFYADRSGLSKADSMIVADTVLNRARESEKGADMSVFGLLQGDGKAFLEGALKANGMTQSRIDSMMRTLVREAEERGKAGHTQGRLDGDLRFVSSNGLRVIDWIDSDLESILTARSGNTAGRAAAASNGIRTHEDAKNLIDAALAQMQNKIDNPITLADVSGAPGVQGKVSAAGSYVNDLLDRDRPVDRAYMESMMRQFMGGTVVTDAQEGIIARAKRATILATMGGNGLMQLAETGALMGTMGWREFVKQLPAGIKSEMTNPRSALISELKSMSKLIPEEDLFNPRMMAELDQTLHAQSELAQWYDRITGKGLQVQGMISGLHAVRYAQQKMAMMNTIDKLFQAASGKVPDAISAARLAQIGIDPSLLAKIKTASAHIEWDGDNVKRLHMNKWNDPELQADFGRAIGIATDNLVQRARKGETNSFFAGNGVASLFTQFLSYPLTAITKQAGRNAYVGDTSAMYQVMYGFLFAGMVGSTKAVINGRYEDLNPVDFAKSGFVQANITGWVPLISDPLMSLLGFESLKFNQYGDVIRSAPAGDVLNHTLKAPASIAGILTGDFSKQNLKNLRYLPVIGNWYGLNALINRLD